MVTTMEVGAQAFFIESNRIVREVTVVRRVGEFYTVRFDCGGGIQLRNNRLFSTREDAEEHLPFKPKTIKQGFRSPYDFDF